MSRRTFAKLAVPAWLRTLLSNTSRSCSRWKNQICLLTCQLQKSAAPGQPRGVGALSSSVVIDREVGD